MKVFELGNMYEDDVPYRASLESETHSWYMKWKQQELEHGAQSLPTSPYFALPHLSTIFPNIQVLLKILCTIRYIVLCRKIF
jgi:hypothetical protein